MLLFHKAGDSGTQELAYWRTGVETAHATFHDWVVSLGWLVNHYASSREPSVQRAGQSTHVLDSNTSHGMWLVSYGGSRMLPLTDDVDSRCWKRERRPVFLIMVMVLW